MDTHYDVGGAHIAPRFRPDVVALPAELRRLLEDELAAGNTIVDVGHSHPAPPIGAYIMLADRVSTRDRRSADGVSFYERNSSLYRGEFTDADARYWILEAPEPDDADYPDPDAIRAAHEPPPFEPMLTADGAPPEHDADAYRRFLESMQLNYDRWHDGTGYDLEALRALSDSSRQRIESLLTPPNGWRDVEALAVMDTTTARETLRQAARGANVEVAVAVTRYASEVVDESVRADVLAHAIANASLMDGLSAALDEAETFHPPAVERALFAGLLTAPSDVAYHCAATLAVAHGAIESRVDWDLRPLFLEFNTPDPAARRSAFLTLCRTLELDGESLLAGIEQSLSHSSRELS